MEVKINKEIRNYTESMFFGLSLRQFIFSVLACGVAVCLYFLLRPRFGTETLSWVCILGAFPFAAMGFIKYNDMTAEQFGWAWIKSEFLMPKKLMFLPDNALYDTIVELEERIEDAKLRKSSIEMETITLDNIYKLMLNFGKLYDIISDEEKKSLITYLIKKIQIYPNGESEQPLKSIEFNFPIYRDGQEVRRLLWEKGNTIESVVLLTKVHK